MQSRNGVTLRPGKLYTVNKLYDGPCTIISNHEGDGSATSLGWLAEGALFVAVEEVKRDHLSSSQFWWREPVCYLKVLSEDGIVGWVYQGRMKQVDVEEAP